MIESNCACGHSVVAAASQIGSALRCEQCGRNIYLICAENLPESGGGGDFDAQLVVESGPEHQGDVILLGGIEPITIGKLPDRSIVLNGNRVSRFHCKLVRLDFGPSRWELQDNNSTNGMFVNDLQLQEHELQDGDVVRIGEYVLRYALAPEAPGLLDGGTSGVATAVEASPATRVARAPKLDYGRVQPAGDRPPLGECDIDWVMKLRNASTLMVWVININFLKGFFLPESELLEVAVDALTSIMSFGAAWLLTSPEPDAPESQSWFSVRLFLRLTATLTIAGELMLAGSVLLEDESLMTLGVPLALMIVPQTALFLYYLRRLAIRIPNPALAVNILIVLIALPSLLAATLFAAYFAVQGNSPGVALLTGVGGLVGLLILRIWYLCLLIWFNRSFS